jgi:glutamate/tyrosine decarboxylase-like PLP-dependent enzyme
MASIPEQGRPWEELREALAIAKQGDYSWRQGRMALYFYYLDDDLARVQQQAYLAFWTENNLGHRAFPSLKRLEEEVIGMSLPLMHAPEGAGASFTSGGSESIFLALLAAREKARAEKGITSPNIVLPQSAHLTFDRAAWYLGIEVRRVPTRPDFRADVDAMAARIDASTILTMGSAPNYPFGCFDEIDRIAALARERGIWMHVDACVGGFLSPFAEKLGHPIPAWDFRVPGVTSISADIHKHGMAPKGASLMLVRDEALRRFHKFESRAWERGPYAAYTTQGTRPGGAVAAAWAVMNYLGENGYKRCAQRILDAKRVMTEGIAQIPGLEVLSPSDLCIYVYKAREPSLEIAKVAAALDRRGWLVGRQQQPDGIHFHVNPVHAEIAEDYVSDVRAAVAEAAGGGVAAMAEGRTY